MKSPLYIVLYIIQEAQPEYSDQHDLSAYTQTKALYHWDWQGQDYNVKCDIRSCEASNDVSVFVIPLSDFPIIGTRPRIEYVGLR